MNSQSLRVTEPDGASHKIAIVGMAGRFPGARNVDEFWTNLRAGKEAIHHFSDRELIDAGENPDVFNRPNYVKARGVLANVDRFDAAVFGFSPREAALTDPQQRIFLECAWAALEDAGYDPHSYPGAVGVYAGAGWNSYMLFNLASHRQLFNQEVGHQTLLANEKDNLATRTSYKLDLKGPSVTVQTGCSTSLVATTLAFDALLSYQCDMALSGGVSVTVPQTGYLHLPGGIFSPDGHCRAFDADAKGTVIGSGAGVIVLKRLEDAIADRDHIYAVLSAAAINNDGALKAGYTAPSVRGQAEAILQAHAMAEVPAEAISYVEAHGTGTVLGDPIELAALTKAFRQSTLKNQFCAIGSVKTNIGHLDAAAGIAGLIKVALALKHREIPASLHFDRANPEIDFGNSPFFVNTTLTSWPQGTTPRRAGVSSFGLGGTNAHVIVEEAPPSRFSSDSCSHKLIVLSAKTDEALEEVTNNLAEYLRRNGDVNLDSVAYTLQVGRRPLPHRRILVSADTSEAVGAMSCRDRHNLLTGCEEQEPASVAFMFSGQGAQYINMARGLYEQEPAFRKYLDLCFSYIEQKGVDLQRIIFPTDLSVERARGELKRTIYAQPALFSIEYALAQLWISWGVPMDAAIGHSVGEYVAATIAGVLSLEDALFLVFRRAELMQSLPEGRMMAVAMSKEEVVPLLGNQLSLAAVNTKRSCVVSGPAVAIERMSSVLVSKGISCRLLETSHAFHSDMMDPVVKPFADVVRRIQLQPPQIPYISTVTGTWITAAEATNPDYWATHIRNTVYFSDGLDKLSFAGKYKLLEVGPGRTLTQLAKRHLQKKPAPLILSSVPLSQDNESDYAFILKSLGQLWITGTPVNWSNFSRGRTLQRVPLPTYPFNHAISYWISEKRHETATSVEDRLWDALTGDSLVHLIANFDLHSRPYFPERELLNKLSIAYIYAALVELGVCESSSHSVTNVTNVDRVDTRYHQLTYEMVNMLKRSGAVKDSNGAVSTGLDRIASFGDTFKQATEEWRKAPHILNRVIACGEALPRVLSGACEPLSLFEDAISAESLSSEAAAPEDEYFKGMLRTSVEAIVKAVPFASLRVLEIGGGTGIATQELLTVLPAERTTYVFTDVSKAFLLKAKQKCEAFSSIRYDLLDIEKSPGEQGYAPHSFDVIVAVKMLHVTRNVGKALDNVRSLLAPGGVLLVWEITESSPEFAITYGLLMNPTEDVDRSQGSPFPTKERWLELLQEHGFDRVAVCPNDFMTAQQVLIARADHVKKGTHRNAFTLAASLDVKPTAEATSSKLTKKKDVAEWSYVPSWKRSHWFTPTSASIAESTKHCLMFIDHCGVGNEFLKEIESQTIVTVVRRGNEFHWDGTRTYTINPHRRSDYTLLIQSLRERSAFPQKVLHLWTVNHREESELTEAIVEESQYTGFYSLLFLVQAIGDENIAEPMDLEIISNNLHEVVGGDVVCPQKATILGACRVIPLEYPHIRCRSIDIGVDTSVENAEPPQKLWEQLRSELASHSPDQVVAFRGSHRWLCTVEPAPLKSATEVPIYKSKGVYLITGGLGKIGLTIARHLANTVQARLVLLGRSPFPKPDTWDDWLRGHAPGDRHSQIIRKLVELQTLGSETLILTADVASVHEMQAAIADAKAAFGKIDGVIHSAGVLGDGGIQAKTTQEVADVFRSKIIGTLLLDHLLGPSLDFLVLFSSLSAVKPGFGQIAYSAANNFIDAFVHSSAVKQLSTRCISWDVWQGDGMAYDAVAPLRLKQLKEDDFKERGILPSEGVDVFGRILSSGLRHVYVSTSDYLTWSSDRDLSHMYFEQLKVNGPSPALPRKHPSKTYAPPATETQEVLVGLWQELLGIDGLGSRDDFFELGGDSLIGTQLLSRIKSEFGVILPTKSLYTNRTIESLSRTVEETLLAQSSKQELDSALHQLKNTSEAGAR